MSRETDLKAVMDADGPLAAVLTGGVYAYGSLGLEGITRESVPAAFDANGFLKPCSVVKVRAAVPDGGLDDMITQQASTQQALELWFYEDSGYTNIDAAMLRSKVLFHGYKFNDSFPLEWMGIPVPRGKDEGALKGKSMARQDWLVIDIQ